VTGHDAARLAPLPIRPRPSAGEPANRYVRRLATANHLRPSYLNSVLRNPFPGGEISPERLAALTGRQALTLKRTLNGLGRSRHKPPPRLPGAATVFLRGTIDAWTAAEPGISALTVWKRLLDEHEADIAYPTVVAYLRSHGPARPGKTE
jgi:hypothetical protein